MEKLVTEFIKNIQKMHENINNLYTLSTEDLKAIKKSNQLFSI